MLAVGSMYLAISATTPLRECTDAFSDHWHRVVVFYTVYLVVPLLKWHLHFTWHSITTKGVDWMVPSHNPMASVFIRCPMSSLGWAGAGRQGCCPLGSHPPPSGAGARGLDGCSGEPTLPLSEKWPPGHLHWDPHFLQDFPKVLWGFWGCIQLSECKPLSGDPPWAGAIHYPQDPQGLLACVVGFSHLGGC